MGRPDVKINLTNGNLGRAVASKDGVAALIGSGIAVANKFALGDVLGPIYKPEDAAAFGIDADYDSTNKVLLYRHIVDFFATAGNGAPMYIMPVANTVTLADMADKTQTYAAKLISQLDGEVRIIMLTRVPDASYVPTYTSGLDDDVKAAAINAQALWLDAFAKFRPPVFLIEGRAYQGTAGSLLDLRDAAIGPNANRIGIVISADPDISAAQAEYAGYANVGLVGGRMAAIPVQRNIGRVRDGKLPVTKAGLSDGIDYSQVDETDLTAIHDKGYILEWKHTGIAGFYFNMDNAACPISDDYAYLSRGRTIDKAARLLRQVYLQDLLDEVEVDENGKLEVSVIKNFQAQGKNMIETNMLANGEASAVDVYVDPDQDILATDKLEVQLRITPVGIAKEIIVTLGFQNPANA